VNTDILCVQISQPKYTLDFELLLNKVKCMKRRGVGWSRAKSGNAEVMSGGMSAEA
jgi:hypothetical protein